MRLGPLLALPLLPALFAQGEELRSPSGRLTARVAGGEAVVSVAEGTTPRELARWRDGCGASVRHLLADEGPTLVHVDPEPREGAPALRLGAVGAQEVALGAAELGLGAERPWIELGPETVRLERAEGVETLDLLALDGRIVAVDLAARSASIEPAARAAQPTVEPSALPEGGRLAELVGWDAPSWVAVDEELQIRVELDLENTATELAGFQIVRDKKQAVWNVLPLTRGATHFGYGPKPLRTTARIGGLPLGRQRLRVDGKDGHLEALPVREVRVLPAGTLVELVRSGGFAGIQRTIRLDTRARLAVEGGGRSRLALVARARCEPVRAQLARLPEPPPERASRGGADLLRSEFLWRGPAGWRGSAYDDTTIPPEFVALATALEELAEPAPR